MSPHATTPLSAQILQEATTWFVEFSESDVGQADREAFVAWLKTSPEHVRAYLQVTAHWEEAGSLSQSSVPSIDDLTALAREPTPDNVFPIGNLQRGVRANDAATADEKPDDRKPARFGGIRPRRYLVAASVAVAMIGASALYWFESVRNLYATDIGEQRSIRLEDGSTVDLNALSKIRVTLGKHERHVELIDGQALFRVAKDHSRPFIVHSGDTSVMAVGTQFDVNRHRSRTTVTVVEGRVAVFGGAPSDKNLQSTPPAVSLTAGEQLTVSSAAVKVAANADVAAAIAWTQKQIVFNSTPLSDVADEFNRYNVRQLVITDPTIADTRISGEFSSANPDSLLKGLDGLAKFRIRETPERIEISAR